MGIMEEFGKAWNRSDYDASDTEEHERYSKSPTYNRDCRADWHRKATRRLTDNDDEET